MCRLLLVKSKDNFSIAEHLKKFSQIAKTSSEYQGNGWGCAYKVDNEWKMYKNLTPIWDDDLEQFGTTTELIAHARSAADNEPPITIECNMPFQNKSVMYGFNGFLKGVRLPAEGIVGSEKVFNYINRFYNGNLFEALSKALTIIKKRSEYIKALNIVMTNQDEACVCCMYNENKEYYTLHMKKTENMLLVCSMPYLEENGWHPLGNNTITPVSVS